MLDEPLLDVGHHPEGELGGEDAGVLALVLLEDVGLHRAAHVASTQPDLGASAVGLAACSARSVERWSIAVLRNMARIVGAGPLIVIDTDVDGSHRSKPS